MVRLICDSILCMCVLQTGKKPVDDLFSDLCDGRRLLELLEGLAGRELVRVHMDMHFSLLAKSAELI